MLSVGRVVLVTALVSCAVTTDAHTARSPRALGLRSSHRTHPHMRALPSDIKGLVDELRVSTQTALSARVSRIDIELPLGMGLMSGDKSKDVHVGSRELARIFCEMFAELKATTVVAFNAEPLAKAAQQEWGKAVSAKCITLVAPSPADMPKAVPASGFGVTKTPAKAVKPGKTVASGGVPAGTDIVFAVGPFDERGYRALETISRRFDQSVLVVLLNAHLDYAEPFASAAQRDYFAQTFERVFCFRPLVTGGERSEELLVYKAFPDGWTLARVRTAGAPQPIAEQPTPFAREDIERALERAGPAEPKPAAGPIEALSSLFNGGASRKP
jgi:hypothetical protein